jgi:hypothetical protein
MGLRGWSVTGPGDGRADFKLSGYAGGLDAELRHEGRPCAVLRATVPAPESHAVIMQSIRSTHYRGARVRFSAWVRAAR